MRTALITGGNGNLGRLIAERLTATGTQVIKFDVPGTEPESIHKNEQIVSGDIRDTTLLEQLISDHQPDTVFHLASLLSGSSEINLEEAWSINATASFQLLRLAHEHGVETFFFASTAATYGPVDTNPTPNDYPQWPESLYGATKVAVERLGVYFRQKHGLDFRALRFPLVVSPFAPKSAVTAYPAHALRAAIAREHFSFPTTHDTGISSMFIDDVIDSILDFCSAPRSALSVPIYNLHAYYLDAAMVADNIRARYPDFAFDYVPDAHAQHLISSWPDVADDSPARHDWGWEPKFDFEQSMDRLAQMLRAE